jgi:DNA (cytosine-5)-methyltransferase 1
MRFVDLFCGAGGLSYGMSLAGHEPVAAFDCWEPAIRVFNANVGRHGGHPGIRATLADLSDFDSAMEAIGRVRDIDMIVGGPPCQDFSTANGYRAVESGRTDLTATFAQIVAAVRPRAFIMENVANVVNSPAFGRALGHYDAGGYTTYFVVMDAADCGMAQRRKRCIVLGTQGRGEQGRLDLARLLSLVAARREAPISVEECFLRQGHTFEGGNHYYQHPLNYGKRAIHSIKATSPTIRGINRGMPSNYQERVDGLEAKIGRREVINGMQAPKGLRNLTTEERGMLQGFPKDWDWTVAGTKTAREKAVGNAVPAGMAARVGLALADWDAGREAPHLTSPAPLPFLQAA